MRERLPVSGVARGDCPLIHRLIARTCTPSQPVAGVRTKSQLERELEGVRRRAMFLICFDVKGRENKAGWFAF